MKGEAGVGGRTDGAMPSRKRRPADNASSGVESPARLERKYREIAELTRPRCMEECPEPGACCAPRYCDEAERRAGEFGVRLSVQRHPSLKFMGAAGCVAPPYLRPLCAVHVCEFHVLRDPRFAGRYLALREEVCVLEEKLGPSWPRGMARDYRE